MAQLLLRNIDNTHSDPVEDRREFKRGDIVSVAEDGAQFGTNELTARFRIVSVPGPKADYVHLLAPEPASPRDVYPRSMFEVKRTIPAMKDAVRQAFIRKHRAYYVDDTDTIQRKVLDDA